MDLTSHSRINVFTGKGGVGKTTLALSYAYFLAKKYPEKKIEFVAFNNESENLCKSLGLNFKELVYQDSVLKYITSKLKSSTIAKWVSSTSFFNIIINVIPGFAYLVFWGEFVYELEKDDNLIYIVDAPATGHAMTMYQSLTNFEKIFKQGLLFNDVKNIINFLSKNENLKTFICTLANKLSIEESHELKQYLNESNFHNEQIVINGLLSKLEKIEGSDYLDKKILLEKEEISNFNGKSFIPYSVHLNEKLKIEDISKQFSRDLTL